MREDTFRFDSRVLSFWLSLSYLTLTETLCIRHPLTDVHTGSETLPVCSKPRPGETLIMVISLRPECCWRASGAKDPRTEPTAHVSVPGPHSPGTPEPALTHAGVWLTPEPFLSPSHCSAVRPSWGRHLFCVDILGSSHRVCLRYRPGFGTARLWPGAGTHTVITKDLCSPHAALKPTCRSF